MHTRAASCDSQATAPRQAWERQPPPPGNLLGTGLSKSGKPVQLAETDLTRSQLCAPVRKKGPSKAALMPGTPSPRDRPPAEDGAQLAPQKGLQTGSFREPPGCLASTLLHQSVPTSVGAKTATRTHTHTYTPVKEPVPAVAEHCPGARRQRPSFPLQNRRGGTLPPQPLRGHAGVKSWDCQAQQHSRPLTVKKPWKQKKGHRSAVWQLWAGETQGTVANSRHFYARMERGLSPAL